MKNFSCTLAISASLVACLGGLAACSSGPKHFEKPKPGPTWDYNKIREVREGEKAEDPNAGAPVDTSDCTILSKEQMIRAKASGCTPVDARSGAGDEKFCCPRE